MMAESKSVLVVSGAQYVVIPGALKKQGWFVLSWDIHVKVSNKTLSYIESHGQMPVLCSIPYYSDWLAT